MDPEVGGNLSMVGKPGLFPGAAQEKQRDYCRTKVNAVDGAAKLQKIHERPSTSGNIFAKPPQTAKIGQDSPMLKPASQFARPTTEFCRQESRPTVRCPPGFEGLTLGQDKHELKTGSVYHKTAKDSFQEPFHGPRRAYTGPRTPQFP